MLRFSLLSVAMASVGLAALAACTSVPSDPPAEVSSIRGPAVRAYSAETPAPSRNASSKEWSGESGASGHPLMTAAAIRAAANDFPQCLARLWPHAARRGISRATYDRHTRGLEPDLKIMDLVDSQPEFTRAVWDYLDTLVSDARIQKGREMLNAHRATFDAVERAYGVDRHFIAAIWGVETNYGSISGSRSVVRSTATLACIGRRQDYFRDEFLAAVQILERGDLRADQFNGSWAGAFGNTQFMPTTFLRHAVDFDRDGRRDIIGSIPDVVASTAAKLKRGGWTDGQTWGYEVALPSNFDFRQADRSRELSVAEWQRMGVRRAGGQAFPRTGDRGYLLVPAGASGPAFLMLGNFRAIMRYNPAEAYALAIGHLADRLRGGGPFVQSWPRGEAVLSRSDRLELQRRLASRGFDVGKVDGQLGSQTRSAIRSFQASAGLPADGFPSAAILARLRD